jgi:hypothetical protein
MLGTAILNGKYLTDPERYVRSAHSSEPDPADTVFLRKGPHAYDADILEIARTFFSPVAHTEAKDITKRWLGPDGNLRIRAFFPFEGPTKLVVQGIQFDGCLGTTFLALIIESCSGALPFRHLLWERDFERVKTDGSAMKTKSYGALWAPSVAAISNAHTQAVDPSSDELARPERGLLNESRYTCHFDVESRKRRGVTPSTRRKIKPARQDDLPSASGTGVTDVAAHPIAYVAGSTADSGIVPAFHEFEAAIAALEREYPHLAVGKPRCVPFSSCDNERRRSRWAIIASTRRSREAMLVLVRSSATIHVFIEIEKRPQDSKVAPEHFQTIIASAQRSDDPEVSDLHNVLYRVLRSRGSLPRAGPPVKTGFFDYVDGIRHSHNRRNAAERAKVFYSKIQRVASTYMK